MEGKCDGFFVALVGLSVGLFDGLNEESIASSCSSEGWPTAKLTAHEIDRNMKSFSMLFE